MAKVSHSNPALDDVLPFCQECNDSGEYAISKYTLAYIAPGPVPEDSRFAVAECHHYDAKMAFREALAEEANP